MAKLKMAFGAIMLLLLQGCIAYRKAFTYATPLLEVQQLTRHTYVHRSFLYDDKWGKVSCNGLVYVRNGEAIVFDTPVNDSAAKDLINWISGRKTATVKGVVVNHFHADCLGGLKAFHDAGITSYCNELTRTLALADTANKPIIPQKGFEKELILEISGKKVINSYHGPAHTQDNIVSYVPEDRVLFGGCMMKSIGSGKGNLNDADTNSWRYTVLNVKKTYPNAKHVVPGHGAYGGKKLLDYTINMFPPRKHEGTNNIVPLGPRGK